MNNINFKQILMGLSNFIDFLVFEVTWISIIVSVSIFSSIMISPYMPSCLDIIVFEDNKSSIIFSFVYLRTFRSSPIPYLSGSNSSSTTTSHKSIGWAKMFSISIHQIRVHIPESQWQLMSTVILSRFQLTLFLWHFLFLR